jgi:hypothetical protein
MDHTLGLSLVPRPAAFRTELERCGDLPPASRAYPRRRLLSYRRPRWSWTGRTGRSAVGTELEAFGYLLTATHAEPHRRLLRANDVIGLPGRSCRDGGRCRGNRTRNVHAAAIGAEVEVPGEFSATAHASHLVANWTRTRLSRRCCLGNRTRWRRSPTIGAECQTLPDLPAAADA